MYNVFGSMVSDKLFFFTTFHQEESTHIFYVAVFIFSAIDKGGYAWLLIVVAIEK